MDVEALARALRAAGLGGSERTAHRYLTTWFDRQEIDRNVPRVSLAKPGPGSRGGRPSYRVEPVSFVRWLRGTSRAAIAA